VIKRFLPIPIVLVLSAGMLGLVSSSVGSSATRGRPAAAPVNTAAELNTLLNEGIRYFETESPALASAAAGNDDSEFYNLGELLVSDGFSHAIINLGREMNGAWYEWSEQRAPVTEPDAYILAWRHIVTAMRSVPGQHFKFLWTAYMTDTSMADAWPGSAYVDYIGTDIFDWYGGPGNTYPHTAAGALDYQGKWQQILTAEPGGLNWIAAFSQATGKPIIIPEWGLDFHVFGGQDDPLFITNMLAWMRTHHAIGLYWTGGHVVPDPVASGPVLAGQGASAQSITPAIVNGMGDIMGGKLRYAGVYLPDSEWFSWTVDQPLLAPWENAGYQLILSIPMIPNPPSIKSYAGPPEPGHKLRLLAGYPDIVAAFRNGLRR
jgi:Glycosyl hydrolase family 26